MIDPYTPLRLVAVTTSFIDENLVLAGEPVNMLPLFEDDPNTGGPDLSKPVNGVGYGSNLKPRGDDPVKPAASLQPPPGVPENAVLVNGMWMVPVDGATVDPEAIAAANAADDAAATLQFGQDPKALTFLQMDKPALTKWLSDRSVAVPANATKAAMIELAEAANATADKEGQ